MEEKENSYKGERERERESNGLGVCGREMKNGRVELTVLRAFGGFVD